MKISIPTLRRGTSRRRVLAGALGVALTLGGIAGAQSSAALDGAASPAATAESVYAMARPRLLQIRTLVEASGRQYVIGSGFLVSGDGLAITNYHVVSEYALEPGTYRLEYAMADGSRGKLALLAVDIANDLALIRLDRSDTPFFRFSERAVAGTL